MEPRVPPDRLNAFLRGMPKAELHVHVEGTLEPDMAFALAERNGIPLDAGVAEALRSGRPFTDLQSFLDRYYACSAVLRTEQDFLELGRAYLARATRDHVIRAEIFFDPQSHTARGIELGTVVRGLSRACAEARPAGVDAALILSFLRHLDERAAFETLEQALPFRDRFIGVGLDSGERGNPPEKFARVFARCRSLGLHAVAHAGEEGPASHIRGALDALGAERIDHGVACLQDPALVARLREERIPITVCPLSNVRLRVVGTLADHPAGRMLEAGLNVSLASDDPAYFGGYVDRNYVDTFAALGLDGAAAYRMARNGLESAFVDAEEKRRLVERLDAYASSFR